jgi:hypothetical protein
MEQMVQQEQLVVMGIQEQMGQQALMQESILCLEVKQELEQMEQVDKEVPAAAVAEDKMEHL